MGKRLTISDVTSIPEVTCAFSTFNAPKGFKGGCMRTRAEFVCVHIDPNGRVGAVQHGCRHWKTCSGSNLRYDVTK